MKRLEVILFASMLLWGCSAPLIKRSPTLDTVSIQRIAVLPPIVGRGVAVDRAGYVRSRVIDEIQKRGISVLDPLLVDATCEDPACAPASNLIREYQLDGVVRVSLRSIERTNFLAGFYNAVIGAVVLTDRNNEVLGKVDHTESTRGGLLFNSNQVIEGIISQVRNSQEDSFPTLAQRYAQTTVAGLFPKVLINQTRPPPTIAEVIVTASTPGIVSVCASGDPGVAAALLYQRGRAQLRETKPGVYCGNFLDGPPIFRGMPTIEFRSPFGESVRRPVERTVATPCSDSARIRVVKEGPQNTVTLQCAQNPGRVRWFRATAPAGPYITIPGVATAMFRDPIPAQSPATQYAAVVDEPRLASVIPVVLVNQEQ